MGTDNVNVTPAAWGHCARDPRGQVWQTHRHAWSQSWLAPRVWVMSDRGSGAAAGGEGEGQCEDRLVWVQKAGTGLWAGLIAMDKERGESRRL